MKTDLSFMKQFIYSIKDNSPKKSDINSKKLDVSLQNQDISSLKSDLSSIKSDVIYMKTGCASIKSDTDSMKKGYESIKKDTDDMKVGCASIKSNTDSMKTDLISIKSEISSIQKKLNEHKNLLSSFIPNNNQALNIQKIKSENKIDYSQSFIPNNNQALNIQKIKSFLNNFVNTPTEREITISKEGNNYTIKIDINITFENFKSQVKNYFKIDENTIIYYINKFAIKKVIKNEKDFKDSLNQKIIIYYFEDHFNDNNFIISYPMTSLKEEIIKKKKTENNYINYQNNENIILCKICHKIDCPLTIKNKNSVKNVENKDIVFYEKEEKQIMNHFASLSTNKGNINVGDCINNAVYLSHKMKKINKNEKIKNPNKFHDFKEIIKYPGLISSKYDEDVQLFILSLIADVLSQKGIKVTIYKKNEGMNNLNSASLQYLFNGFTEKKNMKSNFP